MSLPVGGDDVAEVVAAGQTATAPPGRRAAAGGIEVVPSRRSEVGGTPVRRALPQRNRRTVGAWCFADHLGPTAAGGAVAGIGPHPHLGLHTVTWLLSGELLHRDSLGSAQTVRPGQLNVMTAGRGVSHAEEATRNGHGPLHGIQLWVAQPEATRHGPAAFEHHAGLPETTVGCARARVLVGRLLDAASPARADTPLLGVDLEVRAGRATVPLDPAFEHGLVVLEGTVEAAGHPVGPGSLAYLAPGRPELALAATAPARVVLLGGTPFEAAILMWWNFVGRTRDELAAATRAWNAGEGHFGETGSAMARLPAPVPPWPGARPG